MGKREVRKLQGGDTGVVPDAQHHINPTVPVAPRYPRENPRTCGRPVRKMDALAATAGAKPAMQL